VTSWRGILYVDDLDLFDWLCACAWQVPVWQEGSRSWVPASINWLSVCALSVLLVGWLCLGPGLHPGMHDSSFSLLFYVLIVSVILRIGFVYSAPVSDNCLPAAVCFSFALSLMAICDTQAWYNQVCVLWLCLSLHLVNCFMLLVLELVIIVLEIKIRVC
jgi:hypothetical protein